MAGGQPTGAGGTPDTPGGHGGSPQRWPLLWRFWHAYPSGRGPPLPRVGSTGVPFQVTPFGEFDVNWANVKRLISIAVDGRAVLAFSGPVLVDPEDGRAKVQPDICMDVGDGHYVQCVDYREANVATTVN